LADLLDVQEDDSVNLAATHVMSDASVNVRGTVRTVQAADLLLVDYDVPHDDATLPSLPGEIIGTALSLQL
jgi:hypothetical protein